MNLFFTLKRITPKPIKRIFLPIINLFVNKYDAELSYWKSRYQLDNGFFDNSHYQKIMLGMANESSQDFLRDKIIADFGCGPRGSLKWARLAKLRIGIDVLADKYADEFTENILSHDMIYLKSTEKVIPLPENFLDILFTLNAIDHVDNFPVICNELIRVLKPRGLFIGSFNLDEPATPYEPQKLDEITIRKELLSKLAVLSYRISSKGPKDNQYSPFFNDEVLSYTPGKEGFLWVVAQKQ